MAESESGQQNSRLEFVRRAPRSASSRANETSAARLLVRRES